MLSDRALEAMMGGKIVGSKKVDIYRHLEYVQIYADSIGRGQLGPKLSIGQLLHQQAGIWYGFFFVIKQLTGSELVDAVPLATLTNATLYLCATYAFAWYLFGVFGRH